MIARVDGAESLALNRYGGKGFRLSELASNSFSIPPTLVLSIDLYRQYLQQTMVGIRLPLELGRRPLGEMRWEELWDLALQIRTLFHSTPLPEPLAHSLTEALPREWLNCPLVVRSSAPEEDGQHHSFAGLHESIVGVVGFDAVQEAILSVWASLWSDRALLYRKELKLSMDSSMAVVIQPLIEGEASGVLFTQAPDDARYHLVEAVYGLNEGLVDGQVEPDRWQLDRRDGQVADHRAPIERQQLVRNNTGLAVVPCKVDQPPLDHHHLQDLHQLATQLEKHEGAPLDIEWTLEQGKVVLLQARPITTVDDDPERQWYLSLAPSMQRLQQLQQEIEQDLLPAMKHDAERLLKAPLEVMHNSTVKAHLALCRERLNHWESVYRDQLIPMAHGIRLFGQIYNDRVKPKDSFEFTSLLQQGSLLAVKRNRILRRLTKQSPAQQQRWLRRLQPLFSAQGLNAELLNQLLQQGDQAFKRPNETDRTSAHFLGRFPLAERPWAEQLLQLGRASWRLRDDDNLYIEALREPFRMTVKEIERRCENGENEELQSLDLTMPKLSLPRRQFESDPPVPEPAPEQWRQQGRQLVGQPASPGVADGLARLIEKTEDLADFKEGEVLVCDALDPTLTLVAPMAAAIVERRGGMLIHGAIIAREYGLPCVTGIPQAAKLIRTGDRLTVDGHLGLVTIATTG